MVYYDDERHQEKMERGEMSIGSLIMLAHSAIVEVMAKAGFD